MLVATPEVRVVDGTSNPAARGGEEDDGGFTDWNRERQDERRRQRNAMVKSFSD